MEAVEWQMAVNPSSARTTASHLRALSRSVAHKTRAQQSGGSGGLDDDVAALVAQLAALKADMRREQDSAMDNARQASAKQQQRRGGSSSAAARDRSSPLKPSPASPTDGVAGVEQALLSFIAQKQAALEASKAELQRSLQLTREAEQRLAAQSLPQQQQQLNGTSPRPSHSDIASPMRSAAAPLQRTAGLSTHRLHPTPRAYRTPSPVLPASDAEDPSSLSTASLLAALPRSRKTLLDLFRNSDVQCTGTVSTRDFARCLSLATARELTPAQRSALIARLDRNGAGEVRYINLVNALDETASSSQSSNVHDGTGGVAPSSVFDETKLFAAPPPPPPAVAYVPVPPFGVFDPEVTAARLSRVPPARSVAIERRSEVLLRDADGHFVHPADAADAPASFATLMAAASGGTVPALDYFPRPIGFVETHAYTLGDSVLPANPIAQQYLPEAAPAPDVLDARSFPGAALLSLAGRLGATPSESSGGASSPAAARRFRALMRSLDRDHDRAVTHREFIHGLEQVGMSLDGAHSAELFLALDPQATGFVRYEQVADSIAQHTQNRAVQQQRPMSAFNSPRPAAAAAPSPPAHHSDGNARNDGNDLNGHLIFHRIRSPTAAAPEELANGASHANTQSNTHTAQSPGYDRDAVEPQSQSVHELPMLPVEYPSSYATLTSSQPQQHPPRRSRSRSSSISSVRSVRSSSSSAASTSSRARRSSFGGRDARPFDAAATAASFHRSASARSSRRNSFSSQVGPEAHRAPTDDSNGNPLERGRARTKESDSVTQSQRSSSVGPSSSRHQSPPPSDAALAVRDDSFKILRLSRAPPVPSRARHALQSRAGTAATAAMTQQQQQQQSSPQEFVVHHATDDSPPAVSAPVASSSTSFVISRSPLSHPAGLSSISRSYIGFGADSPSGHGRRHSFSATLPLSSPLSAGASTPRRSSPSSLTGVGAWSNQRARDFYNSQWTLG
jgi:Ca2+-binding EF-hand superfamily protein